MSIPGSSLIELDTTDSTNNYAMRLIDADKAQHGLTVTARSQEAGRGQRGRTWFDAAGQSLLMSVIVAPRCTIKDQFIFNASVAASIADTLRQLYINWEIRIKWPNDIIVNDKKAGGILIENVLRGSEWMYSVIGFGLNVNQVNFRPDLRFATSLKKESKNDLSITMLRDLFRTAIVNAVDNLEPTQSMTKYNDYLYKRGKKQTFSDGLLQWEATILEVCTDGTLEVQMEDNTKAAYRHGQVMWVWGG